MKPVALPPGRAMLSTNPAPNWIGDGHETIGTVCVACSNGASAPHPLALLSVRHERPRGGRATEQNDELATAAHSITSSAWASNL